MAIAQPAARPPGAIRSRRERLIQTLWLEAIGLAIVSPLFAWFAGSTTVESLGVLVVLSAAVMAWSAFYNTLFDHLEYRLTRRVASDRPQAMRIVHTVLFELSATLVTWPLIVLLTPLGWLDALVVDIALSLTYTVYGYLFHLGFDRLRPVRPISPPAAPPSARPGESPGPATRPD